LHDKIKDHYDVVYRGLPLYSEKKRLIGEIDLVAVSKHSVDIFEVKSSFRVVKARKQLEKIRRIFGDSLEVAVNIYFYHGAGAQLVKL